MFIVLILIIQVTGEVSKSSWGYIPVREGAEMFFLGHFTKGYRHRPLILWLQGGPGESSTGIGNVLEVGPTDLDGKPREYAWTNLSSVVFVDSPVGTGYSYVLNEKYIPKTDIAAAKDLLTFLISFFMTKMTDLGEAPFYIFGESYGGKLASKLALLLTKAIKEKRIICNFRGIALGAPWVSPADSVQSYAKFLYANSLIDSEGVGPIMLAADSIRKAIAKGETNNATNLFINHLLPTVQNETNGVNFYNILKNPKQTFGHSRKNAISPNSFELHGLKNNKLRSLQNPFIIDDFKKLFELMNGPMKKALKIPQNVTWSGQRSLVFNSLREDFMNPAFRTVEQLLNETNLDIMIYNGQLDLMVPSIGSENWVREMKWPGIGSWTKTKRTPLHFNNSAPVGYYKKFKNFSFFWILKAGHMAPLDAPSSAYKMLCTYMSQKC